MSQRPVLPGVLPQLLLTEAFFAFLVSGWLGHFGTSKPLLGGTTLMYPPAAALLVERIDVFALAVFGYYLGQQGKTAITRLREQRALSQAAIFPAIRSPGLERNLSVLCLTLIALQILAAK